MAVVFVTRMENGETKNEGLCLKCAKELGIPQVNDILEKMGISDDDLENMENEIGSMFPSGDDGDPDDPASRAPAVDFEKLFGSMPGFPAPKPSGEKKGEGQSQQKGSGEKRKPQKKFLSMYCRDLTADAREGKLDKVIGREKEVTRMLQILTRRQKNNPCLIGEAGVGKTAIAEALAQRIAAGTVPYKLRDKEVHLLDLTSLVAGTQFRGQFESRIKGLIEEVKALGNVILVIDEVHSIVGVGDSEGSMNAANILKPALSRGEVQIIGATTLSEYRKYIEKDTALERRFQPIMVEEPSIEDAKKILSGIKNYYETYHKIHISDEIVGKAVELSERYITDRFLPDKAIDLLDEAASHVAMNSPVVERVAEVEKQLAELKAEAETLENNPPAADADEKTLSEHYEKAAKIKSKRMQDEEEYEKLKNELATVELDVGALADVIEVWTGVPAGSITANEFERLAGLSERMKSRIIGQDAAVDAVCRAIKRSRAGVVYKRKPASFIFAGPTGVGKTELVKVLAADLFSTPDALIRLDMSEYMEKHTVSRLIGSPPGYVGYDEAGQLTEKIRRKPYSVILFDEIEKAHPDVMNILLQILDDGRITDAQGRVVNFENTVIIMTSNAGSDRKDGSVGFGRTLSEQSREKAMKALGEFLRPEFLNRVDDVICFNKLTEENFRGIAAIMLRELQDSLAERGTTFRWEPSLVDALVQKSYSVTYGARNLRRTIQRELEDPIAEKIIDSFEHPISSLTAFAEDGKIQIRAE